jgi:transposase
MVREGCVMMGTKARVFAPLCNRSIEDLVPTGNFYRHLDTKLNLDFIRDLVRTTYKECGRPSVDPRVFFKLQLVMFFEGIRSERELVRVAADRLSVRWYLGYDLDEGLPDHSSLTRIRKRYGLAVFRRFFEAIVEQCPEAGLVWGKELYFDATQVKANASLDSIAPRFAVEAHLGELFTDEDADAVASVEGESQLLELPVPITDAERELLADANEERHDWLSRDGAPDRTIVRDGYRRHSDFEASTTDPDAALMAHKKGGLHFGYHDHYAVDGGKARIILEVLVTPADVMENQLFLDMLWRVCFRWQIRPDQVTGDTTYGTVENIVDVEDQKIRAYVPLPDFDQRTPFYGRPASPTIRSATSTVAPKARCYGDGKPSTPKASWSTALTPPSATPVRSKLPAPRAARGARYSGPCTSSTSTVSAPTIRRLPTRGRWPSGRSGSSRCSAKPRTGTGWGASDSEDFGRSTPRPC